MVGNIISCFSHQWKGHLTSLTSFLCCLKIKSFFLTSFFVNSFILIIISKISKLQSSSILWSTMSLLNLTNGWWHFKKIECKDLSFSSIRATPYSQSIKEDITKKIFNLQSNIKDIIYGFFFFVFFKMKIKE